MRVAAVVLAAGASTRLGEPKQLVALGGATGDETLLERAVRMAREAGCQPVVVVLGAGAEEVRLKTRLDKALGGVLVAVNAGWAEGMGSSIRVGMEVLPPRIEGVVLMSCDQPAVNAEHLQRLIEAGVQSGEAVGSAYAGRCGVPAFLPAAVFPALGKLAGDAGARVLLASARKVNLPGGELDVDTQALLGEAKRLFAW